MTYYLRYMTPDQLADSAIFYQRMSQADHCMAEMPSDTQHVWQEYRRQSSARARETLFELIERKST